MTEFVRTGGEQPVCTRRTSARPWAPFYDLVSTVAWPELSTTLAMKIGRGKEVNDINPAHFRRMAEDAALGWPMIRERMEAIAEKMCEALEEGSLVDESPAPARAARVTELVTGRCRRMLTLLRS